MPVADATNALRGAANIYDIVPYPGHAYRETHPDRLAVIGILFGMTPAPVERCTVLEIGCGDGDNIIPMALALPDSEFTGVDLAPKTISRAQENAARAGVKNLTLHAMDIMDIMPDFGQFDYIIAHGFFSWVPPFVQDKLFNICQGNLNAQGIAFISYNAYPAGHLRELSREVMLMGGCGETEPLERVRKGKQFLEQLTSAVTSKGIWGAILETEAERIGKRNNHVTYHDELGDSYLPIYFSKFISAASKHKLQFLSEAMLNDIPEINLKTELATAIEKFPRRDLIDTQQLLDLLLFRGFRRSLLCHIDVPLHREGLEERLSRLWIASPLTKVGQRPDGGYEYTNSRGEGTFATNHGALIRALNQLAELWPQGERFENLSQKYEDSNTGEPLATTESKISGGLLKLAASGLIDLRTYRLPIGDRDVSRPTTTTLARLQAQSGGVITTLMQTNVEIRNHRTRQFLQLLDGTRGKTALAEWLMKQERSMDRNTAAGQVHKLLSGFYRMGLLTRG